jgi:DNA polymerase I-like protein with 3'-5' exonuclease and polymerase domains
MAVGKIYLDLRGGCSWGPLLYPAHFLLFVHDELVLTAKDEVVPQVEKIMIDNMQWAYDQLIGTKNIIHSTDVVIADYWKKG